MSERGEKGDQGQHGQDGLPGDQGEPGLDAPVNRWAIVGYLIMLSFFTAALVLSYRADQHAQNAILINCSFGNQNRAAMRAILADANKRTQTSSQRSEEEKRAAREYYERAIRRLPPFDCKKLAE